MISPSDGIVLPAETSTTSSRSAATKGPNRCCPRRAPVGHRFGPDFAQRHRRALPRPSAMASTAKLAKQDGEPEERGDRAVEDVLLGCRGMRGAQERQCGDPRHRPAHDQRNRLQACTRRQLAQALGQRRAHNHRIGTASAASPEPGCRRRCRSGCGVSMRAIILGR